MGNFIWCIPLFLWVLSVNADTEIICLVNDFESDLIEFNKASICKPFQSWDFGNYSEITIKSPSSASKSFLTPGVDLSCVSSSKFRASGGVVEINVYMDGKSSSDVLQAVMMMASGGNDMTVATAILSPSFSDFNGWHTLKLEVVDVHGDFEGYIVLLGSKSADSIFLVDSFRYVPHIIDEKSCVIYNETETIPNTFETTPEPQQYGKCVTYNFEKDFDVLFTSDNYLCDGFQPWNLGNYTTVGIPDTKSTVFITPNKVSSCITSFVFSMEPDGVIEANVYMDPMSEMDHIIVIAQKVTSQEVDTVAGFTMYYPENRQFVTGWNVLTFTVLDFSSFDGYLALVGSATEGSTVLIDSVRYIPPFTSTKDTSCSIY